MREGLKFIVEHVTLIVFDFGNRSTVKLNSELSEFPRKGVLR